MLPLRRRRRRLSLLLAPVAVLLVCVRPPLRADDGRRATLKQEIERLLSDLAGELRDVPADSSTSDLDRTVDYAGQVASKARELKDHAGDDSDARRMADAYPDNARRYQDAARSLREMKAGQRTLDALPRRCEDTMRDLAGRLRAFTDSPDPRGLEEVPRLARELGKVGKVALEQAERTRSEQAAWYDRVDDNLMNDELRGSNDPEFRARMETGKNEHKRIQSDSSKCTATELTFGSRRVDCIRVDGSTCHVVEIKPNNDAAKERGREQIDDGMDEINIALRGLTRKADLTGRLDVFRACFDESTGRATLKGELRVYEYCPPEGELFKDFVVP